MDLNADLGEGAGADADLLQLVTSASVACGGHAGDSDSMRATAAAAARLGVAVGAHPSYPDREGFGRRDLSLPPSALRDALAAQVDAMREAATQVGTRLLFVKPHGALYNRAATDEAQAAAVVEVAAAAGLALLCPPRSAMEALGRRAGIACFAEAFADRAYLPDGTLAPRSQPGAVLDDADEVAERALRLATERRVVAVDGSVVQVGADSICLHGDTPGAVALARSVRRALEDAGVAVRPFAR